VLGLLSAHRGEAGLLPLDLSTLTHPESVVERLTETLGTLTGARPLSPATPLNSALGLEVGAEATLLLAPSSFWELLGSSPSPLPAAMLQVQKKLSPFSTLGLHGLVFQGIRIYGGSFSAHFLQPEEGPFVTGRFTFSWSQISVLMTRNWGAELLASRDLGFADPYLGLGAHILSGTVTLDSGIPGFSLEASSLLFNLRAFGGVQFKIPALGAALTLEGEYTSKTSSALSTKVSLQL